MAGGRELFLVINAALENVDSDIPIDKSDEFKRLALISSVGLVVSVIVYSIQFSFTYKFF